ncbi:neuralized-like protein 4 [Diabrotica virgifera virgifera]|uniref:NHR domain-containing protein n=1 Tax=Diabrotica virgifera virgifera TaxID=50390 RepID=A0ABM5K1X2_DIAVI|nr:neuralized-like protein 4 [Diabrotica virgifera virgifera]
MAYFHYRCGERITLINENCTAIRNESEFDHGLVISAEPLQNDVLFEIKIDKKVNTWSGSLEIGVVDCDPLDFDFPPCASKIQSGSWIMSGTTVFKNGACLVEGYGMDLDRLNQDDRIGLMRTSEGDLVFYINGESQGVGAEDLPNTVYAIVDLYGKCVQVTITSPAFREHNNDDCLSGSSVLAIDNDILNVTLGGDLSELSMSSSNSLDIRMDMNVSLSLPEEIPRQDRLRFHDRCGSLVKLSNGNRSAERRRPLDEFNNGVVMTHRPLRDSELFEIRIDRLVDKWSGSIEMGITTHNPNTLVFPATMTNMRSGTIMMSGCGILTNGKGTRREYGDFNLDELTEGDRVGMMRKPDGNLHYFINGLDQGVAAQRVPSTVWGVIDLYGMTIKVSIVERDEREEQNLITRKNTRDQQIHLPEPSSLQDFYDRLTFHPNCGTHAEVINNNRTAHRPNAADDFNNGVVLTARPLKTGELFEVRLDRVVTKWAGSIEIGVTTHSAVDLDFPFTMTNVRSGTWMMTGSGIMHNGTIVLEQYGVNLDRLQVGDRVGVLRKENGLLHFFVNGVDQGCAASNVPEKIYGVIDLYGQAVEATIIDAYDYASPDTVNSSLSNTTLYSDLRFHHVHGKNARIVNNGLTALRPRPLAEFNDAIVFSSRPLRDGELFEICLDSIVDRWSGSIELGVTSVRPDEIDLPSTATDLYRDTWMLSGSSIMINGKTIKNNYSCDLDVLTSGIKLGVMRSSDKSLEFYKNGVAQGIACVVPHTNIYAVVDLYGQCAQVSIPCATPTGALTTAGIETSHRSDTSASLQATSVVQPPIESDLHRFSEIHSKGVTLDERGRLATRSKDFSSSIVFSATPLHQDEMFEISLMSISKHMAGTLSVGVTEVTPALFSNTIPAKCYYLSGTELRYQNKILQFFTPSLNWLNCNDRIGLLKTSDSTVKVFINGEELSISFPPLSETIYAVFDLRGSCAEIGVTSHKANMSPLNSVRLQDSIELVLDQEPIPESSEGKDIPPQISTSPIFFEFHENHGRNIELINNKTTARRVASYNQGITIVQKPLEPNSKVEVIVEELESRWKSSLIVGLIVGIPERLNLPVNALAMKPPSCIIANDWLAINGVKSCSNYGERLGDLTIGDKVGLILTESRCLQISINGIEEEPLALNFPIGQSIYAIFDLYGQCQQIKILNKVAQEEQVITKKSLDCEKADLESCEKEGSETKLTLPIPSASTSVTSSVIMKTSHSNTPLKSCPYKEEVEKFKKKLLLPDHYFNLEEPICYCQYCSKARSSDEKENLLGWVKFPLSISENMSTDKWHYAFHFTKLGGVRCILDRGQPLTKGQAKWCNFTGQKADDVQIVFYPSLQTTVTKGYKTENNREVYAAFQLLVKPGAYSISRDTDVTEWSTKESGALVLNALLLKIQ